jgi:hypothetical protein
MRNTIRSLILIIILSVIALFLKRRINTGIELESTNEPDLKVVSVNEETNEEETNEDEMNENDLK